MDVNKRQEDSVSMAELEDEELCEALAVLSGSDPDKCSYPRVRHNTMIFLVIINLKSTQFLVVGNINVCIYTNTQIFCLLN